MRWLRQFLETLHAYTANEEPRKVNSMATEVKELTPVRVIHEQSFAVTLKVEYMRSNGTHGGGMLAYESDDGTVVICDELTRQFVFASPDQWRVKQKRDDAGHPK